MNVSRKRIFINAIKKFGTPIYLYEASQLRSSFFSLRESFPKEVDIFYSLKANPNITITDELRRLGAAAEVCSLIELKTAVQAGHSPENIIFVGPAKSKEELSLSIELGIYAIVCESFEEVERIEALAKIYNKPVSIAFRINPEFESKSAMLKMGGKPTQFGIDQAEFLSRFSSYVNRKNIICKGIHIYNGTRILDHGTVIENTQNILSFAEMLQQKFKIVFQMVDFGGGLGIAYHEGEPSLDLAALRQGISPIISSYLDKFPGTRLILESGRFLVGMSGTFISEIQFIKKSQGENFLVTDGGTNCHMAAVGIGSFVKRNFPISLLSQVSQETRSSEDHENYENHQTYNIAGPLCTPGDLIAKKVNLPEANVGDWVLVHHSGAYGPTASPVLFLSHGYPAEALIISEEAYLIRRPDVAGDLLGKQILISRNLNKQIDKLGVLS